MDPITTLRSRVIPLVRDHVDTDQIIPARFLKAVSKDGLDRNLFADWRYDSAGVPRPDFILNRPEMQGRKILLVGENFGSGSSREHAPWALTGWGVRAILARSFADIFRNNALKNGLLPVVLPAADHERLVRELGATPEAEVEVDLSRAIATLPWGAEIRFPIDPFSQTMLLRGTDELGYVLALEGDIAAYEASHPARVNTLTP